MRINGLIQCGLFFGSIAAMCIGGAIYGDNQREIQKDIRRCFDSYEDSRITLDKVLTCNETSNGIYNQEVFENGTLVYDPNFWNTSYTLPQKEG